MLKVLSLFEVSSFLLVSATSFLPSRLVDVVLPILSELLLSSSGGARRVTREKKKRYKIKNIVINNTIQIP